MAQVAMVFKPIKKRKLQVDKIRLELLNMMRAEGKIHKRELEKTVESWNEDKPEFEFLISLTGGGATVVTGPTGTLKGVNKWNWLNDGTPVRWAVMSSDWRSKTTPGKMRSGPGQGKAVLKGRKAMQARGIGPRPGIKARNWVKLLQKNRKRPFSNAANAAMERGVKKLYD